VDQRFGPSQGVFASIRDGGRRVLPLRMRRTGFVDTVGGLGRHDHVCWVFDAPGEFRSPARRFLADGLAGGQRVLFIADSARQTDLDDVEGFAVARATGAAQVQDLRIYGSSWQLDPSAQVRAYARATEQALAEGYTGLRVAAEATPLVRTAAGRAAFARYEHLVDAYMTRHPFSALCGYDRGELGQDAVAELACMHPLARRSSTALRVFAAGEPGIAAALAGEVDMTGHEQLRVALGRTDLAVVDGEVTIDARDLDFIDHRGLIQIVEHVRGRGAATVLEVGARSVVRPLSDVLCLPDLRVVVS
jgi:hypothetical protein